MTGELVKPCDQAGCPIWTPHVHSQDAVLADVRER